jgi:hypothetical protein
MKTQRKRVLAAGCPDDLDRFLREGVRGESKRLIPGVLPTTPQEHTNRAFMEYETSIRRLPQSIRVLIVVDTDEIIATYGPNRDPSLAKTLSHDDTIAMCTDARSKVHGQGTGKLSFSAHVRDVISVTGTSGSANSQDAVIVYSLDPPVDGHVFAPSQAAFYTRTGAVEPNPDSPARNGFPPISKAANFSNFSVTAKARGAAPLAFAFALYTLADDGENQTLFGYYTYHFSVTVI